MSKATKFLNELAQKKLSVGQWLANCRRHGAVAGFVACLHVLDGKAAVHWIEEPGKSHPTMGMILCQVCAHTGGGLADGVPQTDLDLVCGQCARDRGINRVGGKLQDRERQTEIPQLDAGGNDK